jgi:hypothetical protein
VQRGLEVTAGLKVAKNEVRISMIEIIADGLALILPPNDDESLMIADWVRATNGPEYPVDHVVKICLCPPSASHDEIKDTYY